MECHEECRSGLSKSLAQPINAVSTCLSFEVCKGHLFIKYHFPATPKSTNEDIVGEDTGDNKQDNIGFIPNQTRRLSRLSHLRFGLQERRNQGRNQCLRDSEVG